MGEVIKGTATDGHKFDLYLAQPVCAAKGGIVLIQETFGVNDHIKRVAEDFASDGYLVGAPSLFDRIAPNIELERNPKNISRGKDLKENIGNKNPLLDIASTINIVKSAGNVAIIGYCWGGTLAWLSACQIAGLSAAVSYHGDEVSELTNMYPKCPTILHFGENDPAIPISRVTLFKETHPDCTVHLYPTGHSFNCQQNNNFNLASSKIALERTMEHLAKYII
jgi:carboxymethylenebutenolidase